MLTRTLVAAALCGLGAACTMQRQARRDAELMPPMVLHGPPRLEASVSLPPDQRSLESFWTLADGQSLAELRVEGQTLTPERGGGHVFGARPWALYQSLLELGKDAKGPVQWQLIDLDRDVVLTQSAGVDKVFFGASVTKIVVAAAATFRWQGKLPPEHLRNAAAMLVVSDNRSWRELQAALGDGDAEKGRAAVKRFTDGLGLVGTRMWVGDLQGLHGNEVSARDIGRFLVKTHQRAYPGAELIIRLMQAAHTAPDRGPYYLPATMVVAGKPGSWPGMTHVPGSNERYRADIRHHAMMFVHEGRSFGLVLMSDGVPDEHLAALSGGIFRDYVLP